jgi:hypothetical protein
VKQKSKNSFKGRQFTAELILRAVRWYLQFPISYRDLERMLADRGIQVDPTTLFRWIQAYAPELDKRIRPHLRKTNGCWRVDGGTPGVWEAVDHADYNLLWRSVDAFGPCPIEHCLGDLFRLQAASRRPSNLAAWLMSLDPGGNALRQITTKDGVKARALWELFREETGSQMSITRFGMEMARFAAEPGVPFHRKVKTMSGTFYPLKRS